MPKIYSVAVFCGSRTGENPDFAQAATALGAGLAQAGVRLIYGGGRVGLMGLLADSALAAGGQVIGVIPDFLSSWDVAHKGLTEMRVVASMHARKDCMAELADVFVMLPGGLGTFDETLEILSWRQLRLHAKPVLLCDIAGSAAPVVALVEAAIAHGFAGEAIRSYFEQHAGVAETLARLQTLAGGPLAGNLPGA
ncbi:MAG: TIGR00730 family Rossman fold protein [Acetobacteraceae bacterium]|nr:TIGR00730 family Rossman fold protein [Acetobacteraceae bacterium]MSP29431.1 TIGR00730 family Rossman fold protein [Acetobacteraceae bacterium]